MRTGDWAAVVLLVLGACGGGQGPAAPGQVPPAGDTTIGASGGTLAVDNGAARLVVPAGALAVPTPLTLRTSPRAPLDPHAVFQLAYEVGPAATTFAVPASLVLRYDPSGGPSGTDEASWRLHVLSPSETWEPVAGSVDVASHEVTGLVSAGGTFGVRWIDHRPGCSGGKYAQFDFWLGDWTFQAGNAPPGSDSITKEGNGCHIEEHFQDFDGTLGRSVSIRSPIDDLWHQTYIDSRGHRTVLVGGLAGSRMVLNETATQRNVWDPLSANDVRYYRERSSDGGATWVVTFDSHYTR